MSFLAPMTSSNQGSGFQGQSANILNPATTDQANTQYQNAQQALAAQQGLVGQLQGQGGIQNQSNVFNQQQQLANQLQAQTMGQGPNPAQAALAQQTQANTANQAALMASQRGTSANPGMIARQAAQQGAANQQSSIGQAATLQAQQQLAAQQQLQSQQAQMQGVAGTQVGQLQNAVGAQNQYAQGEQQNILNAIAQQNNANVGMQSNINNVNAGIAQGNQAFQQRVTGGVMNSVGGALGMAFAQGGEVQSYAPGGSVGPQSSLGQLLQVAPLVMAANQGLDTAQTQDTEDYKADTYNMTQNKPKLQESSSKYLPEAHVKPASQVQQESGYAKGGKVNVMVSPGEKLYSPGGKVDKVPGKAQTDGDSYKNDTVHKKLKPGTIVVPRTAAKDPEKSKQFVAAILARRGSK